MTVAVCCYEPEHTLLAPRKKITNKAPDQSAFQSLLQPQTPLPTTMASTAYIHPLVRRSSNVMSQSSLEICTEGLGSETGSGDVSDEDHRWFNSSDDEVDQVVALKGKRGQQQRREEENKLTSVNYHCSASRKSASRSFPPPLSSISRRDGSCIQMRTHRNDGRLIMEAVPVASKNYLHARRLDGRLLLSFVNSATTETDTKQEVVDVTQDLTLPPTSQEIVTYEEEAEDAEEEVEVVDRGTMVEVKVSTLPQQAGGALKVLRSSLIINKFVGGTPTTNQNRWAEVAEEKNCHDSRPVTSQRSPPRRPVATTTTAAAAAVAASSSSASLEMLGQQPAANKLLFTSKRRSRDEMLHHMRRCSELQRPLFFWEAGCIATSY